MADRAQHEITNIPYIFDETLGENTCSSHPETSVQHSRPVNAEFTRTLWSVVALKCTNGLGSYDLAVRCLLDQSGKGVWMKVGGRCCGYLLFEF